MFKQLKGHPPSGKAAKQHQQQQQGNGDLGHESKCESDASVLGHSTSTPEFANALSLSPQPSSPTSIHRSQSALELLKEQRRLQVQSYPHQHRLQQRSLRPARATTPISTQSYAKGNTAKGASSTGLPNTPSKRQKVPDKTKAGVAHSAVDSKSKRNTTESAAAASTIISNLASTPPRATLAQKAAETAPSSDSIEGRRISEYEQFLMDMTPPDFGNESDGEGDQKLTMPEPTASTSMPLDAVGETRREDGALKDEKEATSDAAKSIVVCVRVRNYPDDASAPCMWKLEPDKHRIAPTEHHPTMAKRATTASEATAASCEEGGAYSFCYDSLVPPEQSAVDMYKGQIAPVVGGVVKGYNGTVFAYGQTGSGKTYTMSGGGAEKGVIPSAVEQIFDSVEKDVSREFLLRVSYLEIYNENLHDLLAALPSSSSSRSDIDTDGRPSSPIKGGSSHLVASGSTSSSTKTSLRMFESGGRVQIHGLREEIVTNAAEVLSLLERGQETRHQAATDWNERSSRSHCVFILTVESRIKATAAAGASKAVRISQLNLIDLAGSERAASEKARRKEGAFINKSLLTLGTVIAKLSEQCQMDRFDGRHIPYRDSKLTRLLQTSLGGNARVAVVCTLSPRKQHAVESLSTLRFGQRCKMVVTHAKQGTIMDDKALIARYRLELEKLRAQLENAGNTTMVNSAPATDMAGINEDPSILSLRSEREKAEKDVHDMNEKRAELKKQVEHLTKLILTGKNVADATDGEARGSAHAGDEKDKNNSDVEEEAKDPIAARSRRIRNSRRSDIGPPSPVRRARALFGKQSHPLTPLRSSNAENTTSPDIKPFAMESELAQMRKSLSNAMAARQASEDARAKEHQLWKAKVAELESANKEQEEELDEAESAFEKLKEDRDSQRNRADEEREANRLLQLVAKSRKADLSDEQQQTLSERDAKIANLQAELEKERAVGTASAQQMATIEAQVTALKRELDESSAKALHSSSERITHLEKALKEAQREIDAAKKALSNRNADVALLDHDDDDLDTLRIRLREAVADKERLQAELRASALEHGQEDAERDFADLVQGGQEVSAVATLRSELQQLKQTLVGRERELESLRSELDQAKQSSKPLPVPTLSSSASSVSPDTTTSLESRLKQAEQRNTHLEAQVEEQGQSLGSSSPSCRPAQPASSSSTSSGPSVVELQVESDIQRSRIASLERQLAEARACIQDGAACSPLSASPLRKASRGLIGSASNPSTPIRRGAALQRLGDVAEEDVALHSDPVGDCLGHDSMLLRTGPFPGTKPISRGGSMREYKCGSLGNGSSGLDLIASGGRATADAAAVERALKDEREETLRLNDVIKTQRSIMSDLEASVAAWKQRLRAQHDIIAQLVATGGKASPSLLPQQPSLQAEASGATLCAQVDTSAAPSSPDSELKRTLSTASSVNSPYYGAHIFNRPPSHATGLGLSNGSPGKGTSWAATMPGVRPEPLPLPEGGLCPPSPSRAHRRKTIEHEIESLKGSPRVQHTKHRLLDPSAAGSSSSSNSNSGANSRTLSVPGSPAKLRASRDYYI